MHATAVTFALFFWVPSLCEAATFSEGRSHNDDTVTNSGLLTQPPSASPWSSQPNTSGNTSDAEPGETSSEKWGGNATSGLDVLIAAFFLIAATWLVLALIYSILVLIVVRMRARGRLDVYDESFGRFYLLGTRYYIPFGCVLRRYVIAMNQERTRDGEPVTVRLMTREERRMAMERLLDADHGQKEITEASETNNRKEESKEGSYANESTVVQPEEPNIIENHATDVATEEEPVCTICLTEYEPDDVCFTSSVCSHEFHRTCILEWLERRANTECPCCRTSLVSDGHDLLGAVSVTSLYPKGRTKLFFLRLQLHLQHSLPSARVMRRRVKAISTSLVKMGVCRRIWRALKLLVVTWKQDEG